MKKLVLYRYSAQNSSFGVYFFTNGREVFFFLNFDGKPAGRFSLPIERLLGMIDFPHMLSLLAYGCFSAINSPKFSFDVDVDFTSSSLVDALVSKYRIKKVEPLKSI